VTESEFLERWRSEHPVYTAWGDFVLARIHERLIPAISPVSLNYFIKVPPQPRLKAEDTLLDKAFKRNKNYADPYGDITDKIGMRFVVLLTSDIPKICTVVESEPDLWSYSKDRDYEEERLTRPLEFSYQSVHYVVRAARDIGCAGLSVPAGTPCEIQIRTLLQHAHCELTHDTLYKPKTTAKPEVKRTIAKSMALIEATDEFFASAMNSLNEAAISQAHTLAALSKLYEQLVDQPAGTERSNSLALDAFAERLPQDFAAALGSFVASRPYIADRIKERRANRLFFRQPAALLGYFLAGTMRAQAKEHWPLDREDLAVIFSDLGMSLDH
jgi:putative GTP pyrophosphokinase